MTKEQTDKIMELIDALLKMMPTKEAFEESNLISISELNPGDKFKFSDLDWVLLGDEQDGKLAVTEKIIGERQFDKGDDHSWKESSLRKFLNSRFLETLKKEDLSLFTSDLTADDGMIDYGYSEDLVFILSDALCRKYRYKMPKYGTETWTITPCSALSDYSRYERIVYSDASMADRNASCFLGVAPAILLKPETKILKI